MWSEIASATSWWVMQIWSRYPDTPNMEQFRINLAREIYLQYENHWFPSSPQRGSGYRSLSMDCRPDPVIERAAIKSDLPDIDALLAHTRQYVLFVNPGEVKVLNTILSSASSFYIWPESKANITAGSSIIGVLTGAGSPTSATPREKEEAFNQEVEELRRNVLATLPPHKRIQMAVSSPGNYPANYSSNIPNNSTTTQTHASINTTSQMSSFNAPPIMMQNQQYPGGPQSHVSPQVMQMLQQQQRTHSFVQQQPAIQQQSSQQHRNIQHQTHQSIPAQTQRTAVPLQVQQIVHQSQGTVHYPVTNPSTLNAQQAQMHMQSQGSQQLQQQMYALYMQNQSQGQNISNVASNHQQSVLMMPMTYAQNSAQLQHTQQQTLLQHNPSQYMQQHAQTNQAAYGTPQFMTQQRQQNSTPVSGANTQTLPTKIQ